MTNEDELYISKDIDRVAFITVSISGFFFIVTWFLHGVNKVIGDETDWRPMAYSAITRATQSIFCREVLCRRGAVYEANDSENSEPEDEGHSWDETEAKID